MNHARHSVWCLAALLLACQNAGPGNKPAKKDPGIKSPQQAAAPAAADGRLPADTVVATWKGGQLTYGDLTDKAKDQFAQLKRKYVQDVYQLEQQAVQGTVSDMLIEAEAKRLGKEPEKYLEGVAGNEKPTEGEARAFFDQNLAQRGMQFEMVRDRLMQMLEQKKQSEKVQAELERLRKEAGVKVTLPAPEQVKAQFQLAGRPFKGPENAKVTLVEFSDFECPYCSRAVPGVDALLEKYKQDMKVYFLHFPLSFHKRAMPAAIASECAHQQGKFWEMHDKIFENQSSLSDEAFMKHATALNLDATKFKACLANPAMKKRVEDDMAMGSAAGVQGTPSFYVNGIQHQGIPTADVIEQALKGS